MKISLPELAIRRPVTVVMTLVTLLALGAVASYRTPLEFLPKMDFPFVHCIIPYPGATPEQVENEVAIPAEGEFKTLSHLERISTMSDTNGCNVAMLFESDVDMALAMAEVRDRMERLKLRLPSDVDRLYLRRFSAEEMPIMVFSLFREEDEEEFAYLARNVLQPRLMRIDGVADVTVFGKPEREVIVEFDQNVLRSRNLALYQVISSLRASSLNVSVGELVEGTTKYYVRALGEFSRPEEIADLVIGPNALRLKDVAEVNYDIRQEPDRFAIDKKGGVFMLIQKESEANTVATCRAVAAELDRLDTDPVFQGVESFVFFNQGDIIESTLRKLLDAGKYGGLLALVVLFLFLRRIRPTLVVAFMIPASLVVAFVFMFFAGMTLNTITMTSLIISVGMLVDNSIVVVENIQRYNQLGLSPLESARRGASEVGLAITAATLTTAVVFIPVYYMETGRLNVFMRQFAAPLIVALLASLGLALTVIPLAAARMRPRRAARRQPVSDAPSSRLPEEVGAEGDEPRGRKRPPGRQWLRGRRFVRQLGHLIGEQHVLRATTAGYARSLAFVVRWRLAALLLIAALIALTIAVPFKKTKKQGMPRLDTRNVQIAVELDQNFDRAMANELFAQLEAQLDAQRDELGIKNVFVRHGAQGGQISVYLRKPEEYPPGVAPPYDTEEVLDILWQRFPARLPGAELKFSIAEAQGAGSVRVSLRMQGDDTRQLAQYAERFAALMEEIPNVSDVAADTQRAKQEIQLEIDESLATRAGVSPMIVARTVDFALRGIRLPYMKQQGKETPVWAQFREEDRETRANLDNVAVLGGLGRLVPLDQLVSAAKARSPQRIQRVNGKNLMNLSAATSGDDLNQVRRDLDQLIQNFEMDRGYTVEMGDQLAEMAEAITNIVMALALAVILVYILMSALFESCFLPVSILTTIPLAFVGVFWFMYLTNTPLDIVALIGCVLMVGIVVNNGIVIVDHINFLRRSGMARTDAIVQAGRDRLRPVLMTAITTILGCVPLAFGGGAGSSSITFQGLGRALIGGLTMGTLLTLLVVPLFYTLVDDFQQWAARFIADLLNLGKKGEKSAQTLGA